jgi:dTDP-4-dehydrorhamnose 3,5-epimerase
MTITETTIPGVIVIEPYVVSDERGYFSETLRVERLEAFGISQPFVQENQSGSQRGTLRGLHFQLRKPQAKLCRVISGEVLDVLVDIRLNSPTYAQTVSVLLSAKNKKQIYIPRDFAHGFVVLSDFAEFLYKCDDYYDPNDQHGIAWDDPDLNIDWQLNSDPILSNKDQHNPTLASRDSSNLPTYRG